VKEGELTVWEWGEWECKESFTIISDVHPWTGGLW